MDTVILILWLYLPIILANPAPVLAANIPKLKSYNHPLDMNRTYRDIRILGDHKTFRGILAGMIGGGLVTLFQYLITVNTSYFSSITSLMDYTSPTIIMYGVVVGFGALAGDSIKSFFKRQLRIEPGKSWVPFDQLDFVVGAIIFSLPFYTLELWQYGLLLLSALFLHPLFNVISWLLGLQSKPY